MKKGKLKVRKTLSGELKNLESGKSKPIPKVFILSPREKYHGKECEYEEDENGKIIKILVEGIEILQDQQAIEEKQKKNEAKQERERLETLKEGMNNSFLAANDTFSINHLVINKITQDKAVFSFEEFDNFSLKLNRFGRYDEDGKSGRRKFKFNNQGKNSHSQIQAHYGTFPFQEIVHQQLATGRSVSANNMLESAIFKPEWRFIVGLGNESIYETSLTLHHTYGIPYIPGSAIKGVVRSWYIEKHFGQRALDENTIAEKLALESKQFCDLFGCPTSVPLSNAKGKKVNCTSYYGNDSNKHNQAKNEKPAARIGNLIFFDAFPTTAPEIQVDIMNPHFPSGKTPGDYHSPIPVNFLTVANTSLQFIIGLRRSQEGTHFGALSNTEKEALLPIGIQHLKEALEYGGIGAKSALGYGIMTSEGE